MANFHKITLTLNQYNALASLITGYWAHIHHSTGGMTVNERYRLRGVEVQKLLNQGALDVVAGHGYKLTAKGMCALRNFQQDHDMAPIERLTKRRCKLAAETDGLWSKSFGELLAIAHA